MDDRQADFVALLGLVCARAQTAGHPLELILTSGRLVTGVPLAPEPAEDGDELDDTGLRPDIVVGDAVVAMDDVRSFTVVLDD